MYIKPFLPTNTQLCVLQWQFQVCVCFTARVSACIMIVYRQYWSGLHDSMHAKRPLWLVASIQNL